jgi:hypothetical protein
VKARFACRFSFWHNDCSLSGKALVQEATMSPNIILVCAVVCFYPALWAVSLSDRGVTSAEATIAELAQSTIGDPAAPRGHPADTQIGGLDPGKQNIDEETDAEVDFSKFEIIYQPVLQSPEALNEGQNPPLEIAP